MTTEQKVTAVLAEMDKLHSPQPYIKFTPVRGKTTVFDNKLGGTPYFPKELSYPMVNEGEEKGRPLRLLAQLNFEKLSHIKDFPEKGILQFYCSDNDVIGVDFDNYLNQNSFRVVYHEHIITDESKLISAEDMPKFDTEKNWAWPFQGEFLLKADEPKMASISSSDFRFGEAVLEICNKVLGTNYATMFGRKNENSLVGNEEALFDALYDSQDSAHDATGTHLGGYPFFTQEDPRGYNEDSETCDMLLFQIDSEGDGSNEIIWGDCGVANFFISRENLRKCDFSRVLYTWDCY